MLDTFKNIDYDKISKDIFDFFIQYKYILLISFFVAVVINAVDIFTIKFGIDSEQFAVYGTGGYTAQQRYGSVILYHLFPFARYHMLSQITGLIALIFAALLTVSRHNISNNAKLLFVLLFITYPNFAFVQYFYYQSAYNFIGLLLVVIAYRITENNKNIILHIIAIFFLFVGISSYQTNIAVFLCVMMINVILDFINNKDYKKAIYSIIKPTLILLLSLITYYIVIKILSTQFNSYHTNMINYSSDILSDIHKLVLHIWDILQSVGYGGNHTANSVITYILGFSLLYTIYNVIKHKSVKYNLFLIFLILLFLLAVFSIEILTGGMIIIRSKYSLAFYPAFILLLVFHCNKNKTIRLGIFILTFVIIVFHASQIVKNQTAGYLVYKQDVMIAEDIISKIYNKYPDAFYEKYRIVFTGGLKSHDYPLIKDGKEFFGVSYFQLSYATYKMLLLSKLAGLPYNIQQGTITDDMKEEIKKMPVYPDKDCVQLIGNTIVIKLN